RAGRRGVRGGRRGGGGVGDHPPAHRPRDRCRGRPRGATARRARSGVSGESRAPDRRTVDGCELCEAARYTHWYHEDDLCWIADCEVCSIPMVVWQHHGTERDAADVDAMLAALSAVAAARFGAGRSEE